MDASGNLYATTEFGGTYVNGTVFELVNSSGTYTEKVLHSFTGSGGDGGSPVAGLIMDASGNLYGTTQMGGTGGYGIVFELVNSFGTYTEKVLYSFTCSGGDGAYPVAGLIMDASGNLYGTAYTCGTYGNGNVFELVNSSGTYTEKVLYSFRSDGDGASPTAGLIMDGSGNLYGTTSGGGTAGFGTVFELVNSSGSYSERVLHSFTESGGDGGGPLAGLIMDGSGNLYGTAGGDVGETGIVFELVNASGTFSEKLLYGFTTGSGGDGPNLVAGLIMDRSGDLYGTTQYGGVGNASIGNGTVFELLNTTSLSAPVFTSTNATTFLQSAAGSFTVTTTGLPTPALTESGTLPSGVMFTDNGNGTGTLAGTPASGTTGAYSITFTASNSAGSTTQSFTLTISLGVAITSGSSTTFTVGSAGSFTVTTVGTPTPALSETGSLPSGVTFADNGNGTGTLSGMPASGTTGNYPITFNTGNSVSSATQNFTLTVNQGPAITSGSATTFAVGTAGSFLVTATGTPTPALTENGMLPAGVTFVDNGNGTATLSGTPAAGSGGGYLLLITAANGVGANATQSFTLTVNQGLAITSGSMTTFTVGATGFFSVTTTGFPVPALTETGSLPSGVTFTDNGNGTATLSGTPATGSGGAYDHRQQRRRRPERGSKLHASGESGCGDPHGEQHNLHGRSGRFVHGEHHGSSGARPDRDGRPAGRSYFRG
jgi:large repetitive protein